MNSNIFQNWSIAEKKKVTFKNINLNFGPQHPAAHGVLRVIAQLNGELIEKIDCHIGYLHRGTEKLIETKFLLKSIPYFDRLDYVSMVNQEHGFCLSIEKLTEKNNLSSQIYNNRILFDELTRILNHMLAVSCHSLDVGNMSTLFWAFEEREKIMEFYERVTGARMHAVMYRPNSTSNFNCNNNLLTDVLFFIKNCLICINEIHNTLSFNKIWKKRLVNVGLIDYKYSLKNGLSGVLLRSTGLKKDLRLNKQTSYSNYYSYNFKSFVSKNGDSYDRYLLRMCEMVESVNIITQVVYKMYNFDSKKKINKATFLDFLIKKQDLKKQYSSMEGLIQHFCFWNKGFNVKKNFVHSFIESPKGEFSVTLLSDNTEKPLKCKVSSPSFKNLSTLKHLCNGALIADLVTLIGTIDIVLGESDK